MRNFYLLSMREKMPKLAYLYLYIYVYIPSYVIGYKTYGIKSKYFTNIDGRNLLSVKMY